MKGFAYVTAVVLAVIGIGIAIIAATSNPIVYGPPGEHFTVAFGGPVHTYRSDPTLVVNGNQLLTLHQSSVMYSTQRMNVGWTGYAPLHVQVPRRNAWVWVIGNGSAQLFRAELKAIAPTTGSRAQLVTTGSSTSRQAVLGRSCYRVIEQLPRECAVAEVVTNDHSTWIVVATSTGSMTAAKRFVASFQALG